MPAGAEVTTPLPVGATVSVYTGTNVAVTVVDAALSDSEQVVAEPAQAPRSRVGSTGQLRPTL